jgi:glycerol uptake facilitator-like aquaporin
VTIRASLVAAGGELAASALLVVVLIASGMARVQLGVGTSGAALVGSLALGLGHGLVVWTFGRFSGAQINPLVSVTASSLGGQQWSRTALLVAAQVAGAAVVALGAMHADVLRPIAGESIAVRPALADGLTAFAFLLVALGVAHRRTVVAPIALGCIVTASFWMTGRTMAGNPILVLALAFAGAHDVAPALASAAAMGLGGASAVGAALLLFPTARASSALLLFRPRPPDREGRAPR